MKMMLLKKLIFALPFILTWSAFCFKLATFLQNTSLILEFSKAEFIQTTLLIIFLLLAGSFFIIFATLSSDWKLVLPVAILASLTPLLFIPTSQSVILALGFLISFAATFFLLEKKLKTYLTFKASSLLAPSVDQLVTLILLISSLVFYLSLAGELKQHGFKLPDSLVDLSLNITQNQLPKEQTQTQSSSLSTEQINVLKQNPALLKQYGLDPKILDTIGTSPTQTIIPTKEILKPMLEQQVAQFINPNLPLVTIALAILFFFSLKWFASILSLLLHPLLTGIFLILDKIGFTKYETEQREVKKLVV